MLVPDDSVPGGIRAVVMDFGLGKAIQPDPELVRLTQTGIILGTPEFMSPEQVRGDKIDGRSDIFSLGVVAFELFTGQLPFQGRTSQESMMARLRGKPRSARVGASRPPRPGGSSAASGARPQVRPAIPDDAGVCGRPGHDRGEGFPAPAVREVTPSRQRQRTAGRVLWRWRTKCRDVTGHPCVEVMPYHHVHDGISLSPIWTGGVRSAPHTDTSEGGMPWTVQRWAWP